MGDEQGDRSTPLLVYSIIYQSDQLEEVGVYWKWDSINPCIGREGRVVLVRCPKIKGSIGFSDRAEGKAFGITLP